MEKYRIIVKGIVRYEDKYLVVNRWYDDRIAEPYQWEFIDGTIEFGEAPERALLRHITEQTGLSVTIDRLLYTWSFLTGDVFNVGISYLCIATMDTVLLSEELTGHRWLHRDEFEDFINPKILEDINRSDMLLE